MDFIAVEIKTEEDIKMEIDDSVQSEPMTEVLYNVKCVLDGENANSVNIKLRINKLFSNMCN